MQENKRILDRVRHLLEMTTERGCSEQEAATAARQAHILLAKHNLSLADVERVALFAHDVDASLVNTIAPWRRQIGNAVAKLYFCDYVFATTRKEEKGRAFYLDQHAFIGERHNIDVAKLMFAYLVETVVTLEAQAAREQEPRSRSKFQTSFFNACAARLVLRLLDRYQEVLSSKTPAGDSLLPALLPLYRETQLRLEHFKSEMGAFDAAQPKPELPDADGAEAGRAAGSKIGLDTQLEAKRQTTLAGTPKNLITRG